MSSFSREWAHSLENDHQIIAERSKITPNRCRTEQNNPNRCRTQQNCPKSLQNAAKRPQIFCLDLGQICCVLHWFWVNLLRPALILLYFAAFCIDLGSFGCVLHWFELICYVLHRLGVNLLRCASIWGQFVAFGIDFEPIRCVLHRLGAHSLECELIL